LPTCKSCSTKVSSYYCSNCGEKVIDSSDRTIKYFLSDFVSLLTFADSKILRTLKLLIFNPGQLSSNYVDGVRVKYMRPLQIFFLANLICFLFPVILAFNSSLHVQMNLTAYSKMATKLVEKKIIKEQISLEEYRSKYNSQSAKVAKLLIIFLAVIYAFPLWLLYFKKKKFFTDHFLFGLEFLTYNLVVNTLLLTIVFLTTIRVFDMFGINHSLGDLEISITMAISMLYFVVRGFMNYYQNSFWMALGKALIFEASIILLTIVLYRFLLFITTFLLV
jgi:uncharacterized protein DUF3667